MPCSSIKVQDAGITMNRDKCEFHKDSFIFLRHVDKNSIAPDPAKTAEDEENTCQI